MNIGSFPFVENLLDVTARRQQAFAANIANLDTPGYKAMDVEFKEELSSSLRMASTSPAHLTPPGAESSTRFIEAEGKLKANGNTVDIDTQMTEMTKNGLQYVTLVQYLNQKLKTLRSSLNEGGR
jgi:flagellar basal-body rod protein FlgB